MLLFFLDFVPFVYGTPLLYVALFGGAAGLVVAVQGLLAAHHPAPAPASRRTAPSSH